MRSGARAANIDRSRSKATDRDSAPPLYPFSAMLSHTLGVIVRTEENRPLRTVEDAETGRVLIVLGE